MGTVLTDNLAIRPIGTSLFWLTGQWEHVLKFENYRLIEMRIRKCKKRK